MSLTPEISKNGLLKQSIKTGETVYARNYSRHRALTTPRAVAVILTGPYTHT